MDPVTLFRTIAGYILVLFVPGYALTWALYPTGDRLRRFERIALSLVLSIVSVTTSVLFADIFLGIDVTATNILFTIAIVTALAALAWMIQAGYRGSRLRQWVDLKIFRRQAGSPQLPENREHLGEPRGSEK
ncbi:MAG TPA: DUF1616 domain-containing protein [Methanomicrobiales archaeon]|jgi:uncharacterized membrane protein|nr:DUF1616 domain-containing protein [Methanomicrobiales archaeon]